MAKQENPLENLFTDIGKIIRYMVIKDSREADKYDNPEIRRDAEIYRCAVLQQDSYLTYTDYFTPQMFVEVEPTVRREFIDFWMANPYNIPLRFRDHLVERCREIVIDTYVEKNEYYRKLAGLPPYDTPETEFIYVPYEVRSSVYPNRIIDDLPVHLLPTTDQDMLMNEPWFTKLLEDNPDKEYLKFLGTRKIDILVSRQARDFQLIRYIPIEATENVNPYLLKEFSAIYNAYRDYIVFTIYNRDMEDIFSNYRGFMGLLIVLSTINQVCMKAVEHTSDYRFLDDKIISIIFQMYGIPRDLIPTMSSEVQRDLVTNLIKLIRGKATNTVFYDLIKILGFDNVNISKLMLVKQQYFDPETGQAYFSDGTPINSPDDLDRLHATDPVTGEPEKELALSNSLPDGDWELEISGQEHPMRGLPHFQAVDLRDENPYESIINDSTSVFDYHTIVESDQRWWDLQDVRNRIRSANYTNADSKYIMLESSLRESQYLFEVVYFMRMILDNKHFTDQMMVLIPDLFGSTKVPLFDLMLFLVAAMCYNNGLSGTIPTSAEALLAIAGFNFEIDLTKFQDFLNETEYADTEKVTEFMRWIAPKTEPSSMKFIFENVLLPFKDWLSHMMATTDNRQEYLEYEKIFRATFSYDIAQQIFVTGFQKPKNRILETYNITESEYNALMLFYPHTGSGATVTLDSFHESGYDPFIGDSPGLTKQWYVTTQYGPLYFYDILSSDDLRYVKDQNGNMIPNPAFWDPNLQRFDPIAVEVALEEIDKLNPSALANAFYRVDTIIPGTNNYYRGIRYDENGNITSIEYLPNRVRAEGIYRDILRDKITMDMAGEAIPATTYREYLRRKNPMVEGLFKRAEISNTEWSNAIMTIVMAIESYLNMHLKVFEQATAGTDTYFRSLVTLIKYFKSYMIDLTRFTITYIFDSKIDPGGGSNMMRMFDNLHSLKYFFNITDEFGLFDTTAKIKHRFKILDRASMITPTDNDMSKHVRKRESDTGSIRLADEAIFMVNGRKEARKDDKLSLWFSGESGVGRFDSDEFDDPVDSQGWKEFVE